MPGVTRCYGGEQDGVDVLLVAEPVVDLAALERPSADEHDDLPVDVAADD